MATTEKEIREGVILLLKQYGTLTTSEVKKLLGNVMMFDEDDLQPGSSRQFEPLINQRIGNIVSHQQAKVQQYFGSYQIDKSKKNAVWTALTGLESNHTLHAISQQEILNRKDTRSRFIPRKIDWNGVSDSRSELGFAGEKFVARYETDRVLKFAIDDTERVIHLSFEQGDGAGFDILSLNKDGSDRYIEVKTTKGRGSTPFFMSENERNFFQLHRSTNNAYIYRLHHFDLAKNKGQIDIISAEDLFTKYHFDPVTYSVSCINSYVR